ncbi:uncharacterized protein LOC144905410 [Branchiostoma floridae x Branchiostoma belcheri]
MHLWPESLKNEFDFSKVFLPRIIFFHHKAPLTSSFPQVQPTTVVKLNAPFSLRLSLRFILPHTAGKYPQLVVQFTIRRNVFFFLLQSYLPSMLLVVLSWVSFYIDTNSAPARVSLSKKTVFLQESSPMRTGRRPHSIVSSSDSQKSVRHVLKGAQMHLSIFYQIRLCPRPVRTGRISSFLSVCTLTYTSTLCPVGIPSQGRYPQLALYIHMQRNVVFFMLQTYLPCILIVILSWVSFFIDKDSTPARVALGNYND